MRATVTGPSGDPVAARWGILPDGTAVIESAQACGLMHVRGSQQPMTATTRGVGELIRLALDAGCRRLLVGLGGSATSDAGTGMATALGARLLGPGGVALPPGGGGLRDLARIDFAGLDARLTESQITVLLDVDNPLTGEHGAPAVFGPQKGATPQQVRVLDEGFVRLAALARERSGRHDDVLPGAGAAGGLGFGLVAFCGARLAPGSAAVARAVGLDAALAGASLCLTGEGQLDGQTAGGKTVFHVARAARAAGVPVLVVAGRIGPGWEETAKLLDGVTSISSTPGATACAAAKGLRLATEAAVREWAARGG